MRTSPFRRTAAGLVAASALLAVVLTGCSNDTPTKLCAARL